MSLAERIEKIKREPEHIRLRYVWFCVFLSMVFIIMLWIFSLQANNFSEKKDTDQIMDLNSFGDKIDQQKKVLQQNTKNIPSGAAAIDAGAKALENNNAVRETETDKTVEKAPVENTKPNAFPGENI